MSQRTQKTARPVVAALDELEQLYEAATAGLVAALERYLKSGEKPSKETLAALTYPLLRVVYHDVARPVPTHRRAFDVRRSWQPGPATRARSADHGSG